MHRRFLTFFLVFFVFIFLSGCANSDQENSGEMHEKTKKDTFIDPVDHIQQEVQTLNNAKNNINNAVHMQNQKLSQALNDAEIENIQFKSATFHTNKGVITLELFGDKMPITTNNFIKLAQSGFYDGVKFHRVIEGFMIQGGDPNTKDNTLKDQWGTGGPGYTIKDEFVEGLSNVRGTIAMANIGQPDSGGSQWFINLSDNTNLDFDKPPFTSKHPVFGKVVEGMDVVDAIAKVETEGPDRPVEDVVIEKITLTE